MAPLTTACDAFEQTYMCQQSCLTPQCGDACLWSRTKATRLLLAKHLPGCRLRRLPNLTPLRQADAQHDPQDSSPAATLVRRDVIEFFGQAFGSILAAACTDACMLHATVSTLFVAVPG